MTPPRRRLDWHTARRRRGRKPMDPTPCRHCGQTRTRQRRRGLCRGCYRQLSIRRLYRRQSETGTGLQGKGWQQQTPATDTPAELPGAPGSEERLRALEERARRRRDLFGG